MAERKASEVVDVDGNRYIDCLNNFTSLIHGGASNSVVTAATGQMAQGITFGSPSPVAIDLAEELVRRINSIEALRFCNSGTEAVMHAVRAARAFTNRSKILRFQRGYHGSHELVALADRVSSIDPDDPETSAYLHGTGITHATYGETVIAPYNDLEAAEAAMARFGDACAAILVEPMQNAGGGTVGSAEFLHGLGRVARRVGALLILDEVVTLRLALGGMQSNLQLTPDLTVLGKIIGGGFPIGAFGGREDVMDVYLPGHGRVQQSGTFNASPVSMVAGMAALADYGEADICRLNALGGSLAKQVAALVAERDLPITVAGQGSLFTATWRGEPRVQAFPIDGSAPTFDPQYAVYLACMINGVQIAPRGLFALSTPMDSSVIDEIVRRLTRALDMVHELNIHTRAREAAL